MLACALDDFGTGFGSLTYQRHLAVQQTLQLLREFGVDYAQGYHLGHPQPLAQA